MGRRKQEGGWAGAVGGRRERRHARARASVCVRERGVGIVCLAVLFHDRGKELVPISLPRRGGGATSGRSAHAVAG